MNTYLFSDYLPYHILWVSYFFSSIIPWVLLHNCVVYSHKWSTCIWFDICYHSRSIAAHAGVHKLSACSVRSHCGCSALPVSNWHTWPIDHWASSWMSLPPLDHCHRSRTSTPHRWTYPTFEQTGPRHHSRHGWWSSPIASRNSCRSHSLYTSLPGEIARLWFHRYHTQFIINACSSILTLIFGISYSLPVLDGALWTCI